MFARLPDGRVRMVVDDIHVVTFTVDTWAAMVAHVSAYGDDAAAVEFIRLFHEGSLDRMKAQVEE